MTLILNDCAVFGWRVLTLFDGQIYRLTVVARRAGCVRACDVVAVFILQLSLKVMVGHLQIVAADILYCCFCYPHPLPALTAPPARSETGA